MGNSNNTTTSTSSSSSSTKDYTKDSNYKGNLQKSPIANKLRELFEECQEKCTEYSIDYFDESENPKYWEVIYPGIEGTPYEKGLFRVKLVFPDDYPNSMPRAYFLTKIYHLNIKDPSDGGDVCLKNKNNSQIYNNTCDLIKYLDMISYMFVKNNDESPWSFNDGRVDLYKNNRQKFNENAREWTRLYANLNCLK